MMNSIKNMITKIGDEPIANCNCKVEKQIEEMAKDFGRDVSIAWQRANQRTSMMRDRLPLCDTIAEELFAMKYRKLAKDSVVLSKDEKQKLLKEMYEQGKFDALADLDKDGKVVLSKEKYELLVECSSYEGVMKALKNEYTKGSKETAEKFYDKICTNTCVFTTPPNVSEDYNKGYVQAMADHSERIDQVAKQFGVEIDNSVEHKEITTEELLEMGKKRNELKLAEKITVSSNKESTEVKNNEED